MRHTAKITLPLWGKGRRSRRCRQVLLIAGTVAWLSACASTPLPVDDVELSKLTPADVVAAAGAVDADSANPRNAATQAETVLWGGIVIATTPLAAGTQLEVLGYPLDRIQRPRIGASSQGRFLVLSDEFLEPLDFAPGRSVTILGRVNGVTPGVVGQARHPFATISMNEIHLWTEGASSEKPRFTFGIGINLSN